MYNAELNQKDMKRLNELPEPIKTWAWSQFDEEFFERKYGEKCTSEILNPKLEQSFLWFETKEGHEFWLDVNDGMNLEELSKKYPELDWLGIDGKETNLQVEKQDTLSDVNPQHYKNFSVETIDMMERIWGKEKTAIYCELNAFKYRMRAGTKEGQSVELDLSKEKWYLDKCASLR